MLGSAISPLVLGNIASTSGYRNMILKRVPDESAALDRFFELLDEHRGRKPQMVARVDGYNREYKQYSVRDGVRENERVEKFPTTLTLTSYTDDPGFFVGSDDEGAKFPGRDRFFPTLKWFGRRFGVSKENLTILEPDIYTRWLSQEGRFETEG